MAKTHISKKLRQFVETRANGYCEYCLTPSNFSPTSFEIDHIVPESKDGKTEEENLALACRECNGRKFNRTQYVNPISGEITRLYNPRTDKWYEHFEWSEDQIQIVGKTAIGKTTIHLLLLNRAPNLNLRSLLLLVGLHPPINFL